MVFMLPVIDFPEGKRVLAAEEYDPLRPYLHTQGLRFSFGTDKGRPREAWQRQAGQLPPAELVRSLEACGFAGLLVDRRAYPRLAAEQLAELRATGRDVLTAPRVGDYAFVRLRPGSVVATVGARCTIGERSTAR
jgi:hypothetical protein